MGSKNPKILIDGGAFYFLNQLLSEIKGGRIIQNMRWIAKLIVIIVANAIGIWAAAAYISGFNITGNLEQLLSMAVIFTVLNFLLKPILKLVLGPLIVLTLGFGIIIVNALILYILDILSQNLTIETIPALFYATVLMGFINFVFHLATKR